jgi:hypothetical protein
MLAASLHAAQAASPKVLPPARTTSKQDSGEALQHADQAQSGRQQRIADAKASQPATDLRRWRQAVCPHRAP